MSKPVSLITLLMIVAVSYWPAMATQSQCLITHIVFDTAENPTMDYSYGFITWGNCAESANFNEHTHDNDSQSRQLEQCSPLVGQEWGKHDLAIIRKELYSMTSGAN